MGQYIFDQYSYLHFAVGIVAYFWNIGFRNLLILHIIFELVENNPAGINLIDKYIPLWPGGKKAPDSLINQISDIIFSLLGWLSAYYLDQLGNHYELYTPHIKDVKL